jgi:ABC-type uncharacterized transport system ATPase subunit
MGTTEILAKKNQNDFLLETENLTREFPADIAVKEVNFKVHVGEIRGLIGPNGAGKSTLLHLLIGREKPTKGKVRFKGRNIVRKRVYDRVKLGIGIKFQITNVFEDQTVRDNLLLAAQEKTRYRKIAKSKIDRKIAETIEFLAEAVMLREKLGVIAGELAYGEKQWLEIGMVLASEPELILLDEPTSGMSKEETEKTGDLIRRIKGIKKENTFIIVEHDIEFIKSLCDSITVLHQGQIVAEGVSKEIEENSLVRKIYLGED